MSAETESYAMRSASSPAGIHTDRLGRIRIRHEFQRQAEGSTWVRVLQPSAGPGMGMQFQQTPTVKPTTAAKGSVRDTCGGASVRPCSGSKRARTSSAVCG